MQQIRWVIKVMNDSEQHMACFYELFEGMQRQGPGDEGATHRLLANILQDESLGRILDMGCGSGAGSLLLGTLTAAHITAVDNHQLFLERLSLTQTGHARPARCELSMRRSSHGE